MNAQELFTKEGKATGVFYCEECRVTYRTQAEAEVCCVIQKCKCGADLPKYRTICHDCDGREFTAKQRDIEHTKFVNAEKTTKWDGWVYREGWGGGQDGYFPSVEEFIDVVESEIAEGDDKPSYVWACHSVPIVALNTDDILQDIEESCQLEDWSSESLEGIDALKIAIQAFNDANKGQVYYTTDKTKAVLITWEEAQP